MAETAAALRKALSVGEGILRLAPCWVPRSFLMPGGRLKLHPSDLYAYGAHRGGIDERWFSSTTKAANGPLTNVDEGLSYIVIPNGGGEPQKILLKEAVEEIGDDLLGQDVMSEHGGWNILCKFFDNLGPIPHHMHQMDEHAAKVGQKGKPEAYYFPPQYNYKENNFAYTFMGLEPGTTQDDIRRCLERWNEGDNGILYHSKAYKLKPGSGWPHPGRRAARPRLGGHLRAAGQLRRVRHVPVDGRRPRGGLGVAGQRRARGAPPGSRLHPLDARLGEERRSALHGAPLLRPAAGARSRRDARQGL